MNKDFYDKLPGMCCEILDHYIDAYGDCEWFETAWNEYRQHILDCESIMDQRMPGYVFIKYIDREKKNES